MFFYRVQCAVSVLGGVLYGAAAEGAVAAVCGGAAVFAGIYAGLFLLFWLFFAAVSLTVRCGRVYSAPSEFYRRVFNAGYGYLCALAGARVQVSGLEKVPHGRRFMFVSNHRSKFDNMIQSAALHAEPLAFVSKPENFSIPMGRRFMVRGCYLPIDRHCTRNALQTVGRAAGLISSGAVSVGVYPEGRRSETGELGVFRPGCFKIAQKAACPLVVAVIRGTEQIHRNFPWRRTPVYFEVLKVFEPEELAGRTTVETADAVRSLMAGALGG